MNKGVKYNIFLRFILDFSGNLFNKHLWSTYYAQLALFILILVIHITLPFYFLF